MCAVDRLVPTITLPCSQSCLATLPASCGKHGSQGRARALVSHGFPVHVVAVPFTHVRPGTGPMKVSKRFVDRARSNLRKYQKAFEAARVRDVGESDTCVIISDFLADV